MGDELDLITQVFEELLGAQQAASLRALALEIRQAADQAAAQPALWEQKVASYRQFVTGQLKNAIPAPLRALPGVDALVDRAMSGALDEAEQALSLGLAEAGISMPSIYLPRPPGLPPGPPALLGRLPPTGARLSFGSGPASGGGSLDFQRTPNPRLTGVFGLKLTMAQVAALVILEKDREAFSLFTLLSARFTPGIQLGFGFALSGVGGLIGLNRSVDPGALEGQLRSGSLTKALFGDDPIRNAASVLNTLAAVFRARSGAQVFGPTLQLSWLKIGVADLFNVDVGVFMQFPGPSRVDILGSARAVIPPVLRLQLDIHGEIDLANELIGFHAVIVNSSVMGIFRLTGEAIFRWRYGNNPYVVLTIGGFYPGFNPAPAQLPGDIQRVGLTLDLPVKLPIYLRAEAYLAVTANTFQFGGLLEAGIEAGGFGAHGHIRLDALFQFSPFHFEAGFSSGFRIEAFGRTFAGVTCSGQISGPGPIVIHASITYETPFFLPDISWSDTFTIGEPAPQETVKIRSLLDVLAPELTARQNLRSEIGNDPHVALRRQPESEKILLSPLGSLVWSQRKVPLGAQVAMVENIPLERAQEADILPPPGWQTGPAPTEQFSLAQFHPLSDAEKLNLNACVSPVRSGVRLSQGLASAAKVAHPPQYEDHYKPERPVQTGLFRFYTDLALAKVSARTAPAAIANLEPRITLSGERWKVGGMAVDSQLVAQSHVLGSSQKVYLVGDETDAGGI